MWFVGYTPQLAASVWMGDAEKNSPMDGAYGGTYCAPMWGRFFAAALKDEPHPDFAVVPWIFSPWHGKMQGMSPSASASPSSSASPSPGPTKTIKPTVQPTPTAHADDAEAYADDAEAHADDAETHADPDALAEDRRQGGGDGGVHHGRRLKRAGRRGRRLVRRPLRPLKPRAHQLS